MAAVGRRGQRNLDSLYTGNEPGDTVYFQSGRVCARVRILFHREAGVQPESDGGGNHRPIVVGE
jgi:hypothetical protein